jgi:hypothetical protein
MSLGFFVGLELHQNSHLFLLVDGVIHNLVTKFLLDKNCGDVNLFAPPIIHQNNIIRALALLVICDDSQLGSLLLGVEGFLGEAAVTSVGQHHFVRLSSGSIVERFINTIL